MKRSLKFTFFLLAVFANTYSYSQFSIKGKIIDVRTKEPLAFVNIIFNNNSHSGTTTDIDGKFYFNQSQKISSICCTYVGYEKLTISPDSLKKDNKGFIIELKPDVLNLQEIVVVPGENPANRIIRKVIQNKEINNPENISSFKYTSYNKSIYDFEPNDTLDSDSIRIRMNKLFKGGHLLIMESVTERKYISPDINEEIITGAKVSGFKHPSFAPLATDLQPFTFYKDNIKMLEINYLNPISNGSLKKYLFKITDTLYQNTDTVFILSFKPIKGTNIQGLTGLLYINTNTYAIQSVIAEPFEKGFIDIKIQQQYAYIDNKQWFPKQLNFEFIIRNYPSKKMGISANGKSYIENIVLFPDLKKDEFLLESLKMDDLASDRDSIFWNKNRTETLNKKEEITYRVIDSLGEKNKFEGILHLMEKIAQNKIPIKFLDLDISKTLVYNKYEGTRLGMGLYTNEKILKFLSVGGFFGWGTDDKEWKYGGELILTIDKNNEVEFRGKYQNSITEAGNSDLNFFSQNSYNFRNYVAYRMDGIQQNSLSFGFRTLKYVKLNFSAEHTQLSPLYSYEYKPNDITTITSYTNCNVKVNLRYAYKEKLINSLHQRVSMGTKWPVLFISYSRGIKGFYKSAFEYNKVESRIEKSFYTKNLGETKFRLEGGYIDRPLLYGLLFTGEGSLDRDLPLFFKNSFQTVTPYEFLSDRYVSFNFSHNFGSLLFQTKKFKPQITIHQNLGWGMLSGKENHKLIDFKTKDKGLYETGLQIDNLIRLNYFNVAYIGFGGGVFYRYGPYAYKLPEDNLVFKISMTFSSK